MTCAAQADRAIASCLSYSTFSIGATLTNKMLLNGDSPMSATFLLVWQYLATVGTVLGARAWGTISFELPTWDAVMRWLPLDVLFVLMLSSNALALRHISVPTVTVIKSVSTVLTGLGDYFLFGQAISSGILASMFIMTASSVVAAFNDLQFHVWGYTWAAVNCVSTTAYVLYMRTALKGVAKNEFMAVFLNNSIAIPLALPFLLYSGGISTSVGWLLEAGWGTSLLFLVNGIIGFALSLSSFWCVKSTSPTTYAMVGALNKIPLAAIGWMLFETKMTPLGTASIVTGLAGGVLYTHCKNQQRKAEEALKKLQQEGDTR
eukprot:m51a1_g14053 hypothetical protein (319) ;mRNA; f:1205097-1206614